MCEGCSNSLPEKKCPMCRELISVKKIFFAGSEEDVPKASPLPSIPSEAVPLPQQSPIQTLKPQTIRALLVCSDNDLVPRAIRNVLNHQMEIVNDSGKGVTIEVVSDPHYNWIKRWFNSHIHNEIVFIFVIGQCTANNPDMEIGDLLVSDTIVHSTLRYSASPRFKESISGMIGHRSLDCKENRDMIEKLLKKKDVSDRFAREVLLSCLDELTCSDFLLRYIPSPLYHEKKTTLEELYKKASEYGHISIQKAGDIFDQLKKEGLITFDYPRIGITPEGRLKVKAAIRKDDTWSVFLDTAFTGKKGPISGFETDLDLDLYMSIIRGNPHLDTMFSVRSVARTKKGEQSTVQQSTANDQLRSLENAVAWVVVFLTKFS